MNDAPGRHKILLIQELPNIADMICFLLESDFAFDITTSDSIREARSLIDQNPSTFSVIISSAKLKDGTSVDLFNHIVDKGYSLRFISTSAEETKDLMPYKETSMTAHVSKSNLLGGLSQALKVLFSVDASATTEEYTKISLRPLTRFEKISEDIYIKLKSGRYLKLFRQGDTITEDDVEKYSKRQVTDLYFHKEAYKWIINQIDKVIPIMIDNPGKPISLESSNDNMVKSNEIPDMSGPITFEQKFLDELHKNAQKVLMQIKKNKELKILLKMIDIDRDPSQFFKTRIDLVCNISCGVAHALSWDSEALYEKLIYLAYVHDMTLTQHPVLARLQTVEELAAIKDISEDQKQLFLKHPKAVSEIIENDKKAPGEASQIILQHHERASGLGFPNKLQSPRVAPLAALLQISIDLAHYIMANPEWKFSEYAKKAAPDFKGSAFTKVFKALEGLFPRN